MLGHKHLYLLWHISSSFLACTPSKSTSFKPCHHYWSPAARLWSCCPAWAVAEKEWGCPLALCRAKCRVQCTLYAESRGEAWRCGNGMYGRIARAAAPFLMDRTECFGIKLFRRQAGGCHLAVPCAAAVAEDASSPIYCDLWGRYGGWYWRSEQYKVRFKQWLALMPEHSKMRHDEASWLVCNYLLLLLRCYCKCWFACVRCNLSLKH